jgi:alkaline phosphatase D
VVKKSVEASETTFKILCFATPVVGPDRDGRKLDTHSITSFKTEGDWLRKSLSQQNIFLINGVRHWQYLSIDP